MIISMKASTKTNKQINLVKLEEILTLKHVWPHFDLAPDYWIYMAKAGVFV